MDKPSTTKAPLPVDPETRPVDNKAEGAITTPVDVMPQPEETQPADENDEGAIVTLVDVTPQPAEAPEQTGILHTHPFAVTETYDATPKPDSELRSSGDMYVREVVPGESMTPPFE